MEKIVGHKTFWTPEGGFRHEPLTESEAQQMLDACEAARVKRETDMPTEQDAINRLWDAWYRLKELGWKDAQYRQDDGIEVEVIELGSTGIHKRAYLGRMSALYRNVSANTELSRAR